jgi:thiamine-phosphate pyrophosphorylase
MKQASEHEVLRTAEKIRKITMGTDTLFIVNDSPHIACKVGADGVHLGQDDMRSDEALVILGKEVVVGLSTHNSAQTGLACIEAPSYVGAGPVHKTPTKAIADPAIGVDGLSRMLAIATVPVVAIGAIDASNLAEVMAAGARNFCSVRPVNQTENPEKAIKELLKIYYRNLR